jgi:hypothetical protein
VIAVTLEGMSKIRALVITRTATGLPVHHIVNSVFFDDFNLPTNGTNWQSIADDVRNAFNLRTNSSAGYGTEVKVYDMADAEPRPVKALAAWTAHGQPTTQLPGVREVALCLSYFAGRNLPRFRGRLYIGPWQQSSMAERPSATAITILRDLATRLGGIGGPDVDWQLFSPTRNAYSKITNVWVDDEWDTVRSRGLKATSRSSGGTQE